MFERRFRMPPNTDTKAIKADMSHGVLHVVIPKVEETKPESIEINVAGESPPAISGGEEEDKEKICHH